ncbi:MAG: deoxynucleoside kinase [bacterium]
MAKRRGKLIVIDGTDGSGKATQVKFLANRLKSEGKTVKIVDFPDYYLNFFGKFIGHCLSEQYYNFVKVHPKIASVLYAADRFESKDKIKKWLSEGKIVIANRYASANQIHQGGKIANTKKRENFLKWLAQMEYEVFKIPRPDIVFYLSVPIDIILKLIRERNGNGHRRYLGKKKARKEDVHEKNIQFLENSRKSALWLAKTQKGWIKIECIKDGNLETRENIHQKIYKKIKKVLK